MLFIFQRIGSKAVIDIYTPFFIKMFIRYKSYTEQNQNRIDCVEIIKAIIKIY